MTFKFIRNFTLSFWTLSLSLALTLLFSANSQAQNRTASTGKASVSGGAYQTYIDELAAIKLDLAEKANDIGVIIECQKAGRIYDSAGCRDVYTPELDPGKANHADRPINAAACAGDAEVRHFDGANWGCKTIQNTVSSTPGPTVFTYSWDIGSWSGCFPATCGTQTRPANCLRNDGVSVPSSFCSGARPTSWQECNVPWNQRFCEPGICVNNGLDGQPVQLCP